MGLWKRLKDWWRPRYQSALEEQERALDQHWELRKRFLEEGVYKDVIVEVLPFGALPAYDYDPGTQVATFDESDQPVVFTLEAFRLWVAMNPVPYDQEGERLALLRKLMPDADAYMVLWEHDGFYPALRGYWAVRYPKEAS